MFRLISSFTFHTKSNWGRKYTTDNGEGGEVDNDF